MLGWTHRRDQLHLTLVLPDGSRSLIPAAWTDLKDSGAAVTAPPARAMLAALVDLLQAARSSMLFCVVSPLPGRSRHQLAQRRRAILQLSLKPLELAVPETRVREALTPDQGAAVIEILGRLVAKAAVAASRAEERRDE